MQIQFENKTVLVTGGANGIGSAAARLFAASGARVYTLDREEPCSFQVDVTDSAAVKRAVGQIATIDVAAINAGVVIPAALLDTTDEVWARTVQVNLTGAF